METKRVKLKDWHRETKRGREILRSLCLLLASGLYGRGKVENLREIDEYPWHAGIHTLTTSTHMFLFIFLGFPLPSYHLCFSALLSSPLLFSPFPLFPCCCLHFFPFSVVTNPVPQGKNIPHSKGKKALTHDSCRHAQTQSHQTYIHKQTHRGNRHPAHIKEVAKAWWLEAGGCLQTTVILPSWQRAARTFLHSAKLSDWHLQSAKHRNAAVHDNCGGFLSASWLMWKLVEANGMNY